MFERDSLSVTNVLFRRVFRRRNLAQDLVLSSDASEGISFVISLGPHTTTYTHPQTYAAATSYLHN